MFRLAAKRRNGFAFSEAINPKGAPATGRPFFLYKLKCRKLFFYGATEDAAEVFAIHAGDVLHTDAFGAFGFASCDVGAVAEAFRVHLLDHVLYAARGFHLTLRQHRQVGYLGPHKQHSGSIRAGRHASTTTNTGSRIKGVRSLIFFHRDGVSVLRLTGVDRDVASGLNNAVEGIAVDHQVFHNGKSFGPEGLNDYRIAIIKVAHVQLTGGGTGIGSVRMTVDDHAAGAADTFATVVFERYRLFLLGNQLLVKDIEHLQEGHVLGYLVELIGFEVAFGVFVFLSPDFER